MHEKILVGLVVKSQNKMEGVIYFILGSVWTLAVMMIAKHSKTADVGHSMVEPIPVGGAVKAIRPEEIKAEQEKGFIGKMKSIIGDL